MKRYKKFDDWFAEATKTAHFTDAHIDEFGPEWADRTRWIQGGIHFLTKGCAKRSFLRSNVKVALSFMFEENATSTPKSLSDIQSLMNYMPPSIYVTRIGSELWTASNTAEGRLTVEALSSNLVSSVESCEPCTGFKTIYQPRMSSETVTCIWFVC